MRPWGTSWESVWEGSGSGEHTFGNNLWVFSRRSALATCMSPWLPRVNVPCLENSLLVETFLLCLSSYIYQHEQLHRRQQSARWCLIHLTVVFGTGGNEHPARSSTMSTLLFYFPRCECENCHIEDLPHVLPQALQSLLVGNASPSLGQSRSVRRPERLCVCVFSESDEECLLLIFTRG